MDGSAVWSLRERTLAGQALARGTAVGLKTRDLVLGDGWAFLKGRSLEPRPVLTVAEWLCCS